MLAATILVSATVIGTASAATSSLPSTAAADASATAAAPGATATAGTVVAGGLTCEPFLANDTYCGFLAPALTVLTPGQSSELNTQYTPTLTGVCPDLKQYAATIPVVYCLGSLGPCNGANYTLPPVGASGIPDLQATAKFYDNAKFAQVLPSLLRQNVTPPCYSLCSNVASSIINCPTLKSLFDPKADPCEGLPTTNCAMTIGPANATVGVSAGGVTTTGVAAGAATTTGAAGTTTKTGGAGRREVGALVGAAIIAALCLV